MHTPIPKPLKPVCVVLLMAMPSVLLAGTPLQEEAQKLLASDGARTDYFGYAVAVDGDTAAIGNNSSGSVYVYSRDASGAWSEQAKLLPGDGGFGMSVAVSGDTLIGGSFNDAAYVYTRNTNGVWTEQAKLRASDGAGDSFGASVTISGDTAVIGAVHDDDRGASSGSAYVYTRDASGVWSEQAKLLARDGAALDAFGRSVSVTGDTAVIGAPGDDQSGSAYVYTRNARGLWVEQAKLRPSDGAAGDGFGATVALSGNTTIVGSHLSDDSGPNSGSAYVYIRSSSGVWSEQAKLLASDGVAHHAFGFSVAISGDTAVVTTDGRPAYVYARDSSGVWTEQSKLLASDRGDFFGISVAISGATTVIGAYADDENGYDSGSAYVFDPRPRAAFSLHCPGDITGDGVAELVLVTPMGQVRVKDFTGAWVNGFALAGQSGVVDSQLMADTNTNGSAELVLLKSGHGSAQVRDLLTGAVLGSVAFGAISSPVDLEIVPDQTGNGVPELARLARSPVTVEVRDGLTSELINSVAFAGYMVPKDLDMFPDTSGNGWPELAVLGDNKLTARADKIEIRDPAAGVIVREIWLGKGWRMHEQALLADLNGNGSNEVAVLREDVTMNRVNVSIRDTVTGEWLNFIGFASNYAPQKLLTLPDINGNGAHEVAVFGRRINGRDQKVVIKDSRTRQTLNEMWFDQDFPGRDFVSCGDINGNGAHEVAFLGQRASDGRYKVVVRDSRTGERLANVGFF